MGATFFLLVLRVTNLEPRSQEASLKMDLVTFLQRMREVMTKKRIL